MNNTKSILRTAFESVFGAPDDSRNTHSSRCLRKMEVSCVETIAEGYQALGIAAQRDWPAEVEAIICDTHFPDPSHAPSREEISEIATEWLKFTNNRWVAEGCKFLVDESK